MIDYDIHGNTISRFWKNYTDFKSIYVDLKDSIKSYLEGEEKFKISITEETETRIIIEFADKFFSMDFSLLKQGERALWGRLVFSEIIQEKENMNRIIDTAYFDVNGNVKKTLESNYSDMSIKQKESQIYLFKYWISEYIENHIETYNPA